MAKLVLVHGAFHGAWCWDKLIPVLERRGHQALAIDLPNSGEDPTPASDVTLERCAARVVEAAEELDGDVWLVGHSMGGMSITAAAELAPNLVLGLIYVTAVLPANGETADDAMGDGIAQILDKLSLTPEGAVVVQKDAAEQMFYNCCDAKDAASAGSRLQPQAGMINLTPLTLTKARFGRLPRFYVECLRDQTILPHAQARMYERSGVNKVLRLDTDHSPFLSMPDHLASVIEEVIGTSNY